MTSPLNFGVVGLGRSGWDLHVQQLRCRPDSRIVAVADPEPARRQQAIDELSCRACADLDELLRDPLIHVAVIAVPSHLHGPYTLKALAAGKHVVCEKPMATGLAEADAMIDAARRTGRCLFIHHQRRFTREFTHLEEVLASGRLGRLFHIRCYMSGFTRRNDWQCLARCAGGVLNNTVSHYLDIILALIGSPVVQAMGDLKQIASAGDVEDHVKIFLRAENGCTADIEISSAENIAANLPRWVLCGTCGTLTCDSTNSTLKWFDPAEAPPIDVHDGPAKDRRYGFKDSLPWQERTHRAEGPDIGCFYDNVLDVIVRGGAQRVTSQAVREVVRVTDMVRQSAAGTGWRSP